MDESYYYKQGKQSHLSGKYKIINDFNCSEKAFIDVFYKDKKFDNNNIINKLYETDEWREFIDGWNSVYRDIEDEKRKKYKVDDFLKELHTLCEKYNVSINTAGDYYGENTQASVNEDYSFDIKIKN